ncbi:MAG: hypothetical protein R3B40_19635 [Polyangiales bacterium]
MQVEGRHRANRWRPGPLVRVVLAAVMAAPCAVEAQSATRFALAGHGTLVAMGNAGHDLSALGDDPATGFGARVIYGAVPEGTLRPSGGVGGRFEILPTPWFSMGLLVSYARQRAAVGPNQSWRDVDAWLAARLPVDAGPRMVRLVPYLATPVGLSIMVGRLGGSSDARRLGWNLGALVGIEIEATEGFAVYMETGWLMRQARQEEQDLLGRSRLTLTSHQFVLHLGLRGSRAL